MAAAPWHEVVISSEPLIRIQPPKTCLKMVYTLALQGYNTYNGAKSDQLWFSSARRSLNEAYVGFIF